MGIRREQGRRDFGVWLPQVTPYWRWDWPYLAHIREHLDKITGGEIDRLMLFLPPRHGKTQMTTVRYPVWRLEREPGLRVIVGTYNQTLANYYGRDARRIAETRSILAPGRTAVDDWEVVGGGSYRAVGVGSGVTGLGGNLIVIDDPVKSREEAESEAYRERVWNWFKDDLYTRLEPDGVIILIQTRWHEDDLAGRILASEDASSWVVVKLPAEAEDDDPLGRASGEALCPDRYDVDRLARTRDVLGTYSYAALYQQSPRPAEGGLFKRDWLPVVDEAPPAFEAMVRYWDKAATAGGGDYSAGVLMGWREGVYYVLDVARGRWSTYQREERIKEAAGGDSDLWGHGQVDFWIEQEPGSSGVDSVKATIRNLAGYNVRADRPTGDKAVRARPFAAQAEAGNVRLLRARWNAAYIEELCSFPTGRHDDQVDASSGAFNKLTVEADVQIARGSSGLYGSRDRANRRQGRGSRGRRR